MQTFLKEMLQRTHVKIHALSNATLSHEKLYLFYTYNLYNRKTL
jgi:hypothetical protein